MTPREPALPTTEIDRVLAGWRQVREAEPQRPRWVLSVDTLEIDRVLSEYGAHLEAQWGSVRKQADRHGLLSPLDPVMVGAAELYARDTKVEEASSNWLAWILRMTPVRDPRRRAAILSGILNDLLSAPMIGPLQDAVDLGDSYDVIREKAITKLDGQPGRLDVVVRGSASTVVIENKVKDKNVEKNREYREAIDSSSDYPEARCLLVIPKDELLSLLDRSDGGAGRRRRPDVLDEDPVFVAFPAVTWEQVVTVIRRNAFRCLKADPRDPEINAWFALVSVFSGFIESEVLEFDLDAMRGWLRGRAPTGPGRQIAVRELISYIQYRKAGDR